MSAFVVDYKTIDNILSLRLNHDFLRDYCYFESEFQEITENYGNDWNIYEDLENLGKEFLKLNIESVNYRYSNHEPIHEDYANFYKFNCVDKISIAQALKSLKCLMYQSCEIENYKENPTYKKMQKLEKIITDAFVYTNEEYKKAEW